MAAEDDGVRPAVGEWYMDVHSGDRFKILTIEDGDIEVQHLDGDIEAFEAADWQARLFTRTDGPDDPSGALEPLEDGDGGFDEESWDASQPRLPNVEDGNLLLPGEEAAKPVPRKP